MFGRMSTRKKNDLLEREIYHLKGRLLGMEMEIGFDRQKINDLIRYLFKDKMCPVCGKRMKFSVKNDSSNMVKNAYSLACYDDGTVVFAQNLIDLEEKLNALAIACKEDK